MGDSNTKPSDRPEISWCELLQRELPEGSVFNYAGPGATLTPSYPSHLVEQYERAIADGVEPSLVIASFGVNDFLKQRAPNFPATPEQALTHYLAFAERLAGDSVEFWVTTQPLVNLVPIEPHLRHYFRPINRALIAFNEGIREQFPPKRIVDFWSGFDTADYLDVFHINEAGHRKRADRVLARLRKREDI